MNFFRQKTLIVALASALMLPLAAIAAESSADTSNSSGSESKSPFLMADDSWISISGTVAEVDRNKFTLDYGEGIITVEMDDGDRDADAYKLLTGDKVRVNGLIDDDFMEMSTIEAGSVHVEKIDTTFYASATDEEDWVENIVVATPVVVSEAQLHGTVTGINEATDEITVNSGPREITVDVTSLSYDPLDDDGYQQIEVGDLISVTGDIDTGLFEQRELDAETIITLRS